MTIVRSCRRAAALLALPALAACDDFSYVRTVDSMTDQVESEAIYSSGDSPESRRYSGMLWVKCLDAEMASVYMIIGNARINPYRPSTVRVRLDGGEPFAPAGWHAEPYDGANLLYHFAGPVRDELFAMLDTTDVMTLRIDGESTFVESPSGSRAGNVTFRFPTSGFRRARQRLSCMD